MPNKENIKEMFDDISPNYDKLNHIMSANVDKGWRKKALKEILPEELENDFRVLDVACGTGDFSFTIAEKIIKRFKGIQNIPTDISISGADISEGMLNVMKEKIEKKGMTSLVSAEIGDGENLRFSDNTFNRATIAMGIRNFENVEKGLIDILRVLKPGGKLIILELSVPENKLIRSIYKLYFLHILPKIGEWISGNREAYEYLPDSVLKFPRGKAFTDILEKCGYKKIQHKSMTFGICRMYVAEK